MANYEEKGKIIITKYFENVNESIRLIARELKYPESTVRSVIHRYKDTLTVKRKSGSGRKPEFQNPTLAKRVVKAEEKKPNSTERELALKFQTSKRTVHKVLISQNRRAFRVQKSTNRSDQQASRAKAVHVSYTISIQEIKNDAL